MVHMGTFNHKEIEQFKKIRRMIIDNFNKNQFRDKIKQFRLWR